MRGTRALQTLPGIGRTGNRFRHCVPQPPDAVFVHGDEQIVFGLKVVVDRAERDVRAHRDIAQRRRIEASFANKARRHRQNVRTAWQRCGVRSRHTGSHRPPAALGIDAVSRSKLFLAPVTLPRQSRFNTGHALGKRLEVVTLQHVARFGVAELRYDRVTGQYRDALGVV